MASVAPVGLLVWGNTGLGLVGGPGNISVFLVSLVVSVCVHLTKAS